MNDTDAVQAFRSLAAILRTAKLDWLLDEVLDEIRRGKPKEKKVHVEDSAELVLVGEEPEPMRGKAAKFVESIEYTPSEQVEILLSALERGVVAPTFMEDDAATVLSKVLEHPRTRTPSVQFKFLAEGDDQVSRESRNDARAQRRSLGETLSATIGRTREALRATD